MKPLSLATLSFSLLLSAPLGAQELDRRAIGPAIGNAISMGYDACLADERCKQLATRSSSDLVNRTLQSCASKGLSCKETVIDVLAFLNKAYGRP